MTTITASTSDYTRTLPLPDWRELRKELDNEWLLAWKMYKDAIDDYTFRSLTITEDHPSLRGFIDYEIKGYLE